MCSQRSTFKVLLCNSPSGDYERWLISGRLLVAYAILTQSFNR